MFNIDRIRKSILQIVAQETYRPRKPKWFLDKLGLTSDDAGDLRRLIKSMLADGELVYGKSHFITGTVITGKNVSPHRNHSVSPKGDIITGRFQRRASGIGFVRPNDSIAGEIFIPAHWTMDAAGGDTVVVEICEHHQVRRRYNQHTDAKPRGKVIEIIERASKRFVGTYQTGGYVHIDGGVFKRPISAAGAATAGDKVVVEILKYPSGGHDGEAVVVEILGQRGVPELDTLLIMRQFDLPEHFGDAALKNARDEVEKFYKETETS